MLGWFRGSFFSARLLPAAFFGCSSAPLLSASAGGAAGTGGVAHGGASSQGGGTVAGRSGAGGLPTGGVVSTTGGVSGSAGLDLDLKISNEEWEERATFAACRLLRAKHPERAWPGLAFTGDGSGVAIAPLIAGAQSLLGARFGTAARALGDGLLLSTSLRWPEKRRFLLVSLDPEGAAPLSVTSVEGVGCYGQLASQASPQLFANWELNGAGRSQFGWLDLSASPQLRWLDPATIQPLDAFDDGARWGGIEAFSSIQISKAPTSPSLHQAYASHELMRTPVGSDGVLYWTEGGPGYGSVMAMAEDELAIPVVRADYYPTTVGVSSERLVWLGTEGAQVVDGAFDRAYLYTCDRSATLAECEPRRVVELPIYSYDGQLVTRGSWAALTGCSRVDCFPYVIDLDSASVYRLPNPEGIASLQVLGLSTTSLYTLAFGPATRASADFEKFARFELASLADLAELQ